MQYLQTQPTLLDTFPCALASWTDQFILETLRVARDCPNQQRAMALLNLPDAVAATVDGNFSIEAFRSDCIALCDELVALDAAITKAAESYSRKASHLDHSEPIELVLKSMVGIPVEAANARLVAATAVMEPGDAAEKRAFVKEVRTLSDRLWRFKERYDSLTRRVLCEEYKGTAAEASAHPRAARRKTA